MIELSLREFITEREKSKAGLSDNVILQNYRFTNVNRDDDVGTQLLRQLDTSDVETTLWKISDYRFRGSPRGYFDGETGLTSRAYQPPRCLKGQKWLDVSRWMSDAISKVELREQSIMSLTSDLVELTQTANQNGFQYVFHNTEIAKDVAFLYPSIVSPASECYVGKGAVIGLQALDGYTARDATDTIKGRDLRRRHSELAPRIYKLMYDDYTFSNMEHAVCEFGKYDRILFLGKGRKR